MMPYSVDIMARKLRVQYEGAIYHVTIRGVERRRIFDDDADRERFLLRLGEAVEECGVRLYLVALMTNHAHLLAETPQANLSAFMHKVQTAYTVYYNLRHRRSGHLMQGRFGAVLVQGDEYLLKLSRYVHLNPVFVRGMKTKTLEERVAALRAYRWSSYRGYAGLESTRKFLTDGPVLAMMGGSEKRQRLSYRRFVEAGLAETDEEFLSVLKGARWGIGDEEFQGRIRDLHTEAAGHARRAEDVSFRTMQPSREPDDVLADVAKAFDMPVEALRRRRYGCVARSWASGSTLEY
jgi:putative transposase